MKSKLHFASVLSVSILLSLSSAQAVNYWWDNQAGAGFGAAGGTWTDPTASQWSTSNSGADSGLQASVTTTNADSLNFGTATVGLGAGTITVSGTVAADALTFGAASGNITLSGGVIDATSSSNLAITVNSAQATISSNIIGTPGSTARGINKAGSGMLILTGDNSAYIAGSYTRTTIAGGVLRIDNALSLPPGLVTLSGGGVLGLTTATGDFTRKVDYSPGAGDCVQMISGGFAAYGGDRNVALSNSSGGTAQWGTTDKFIRGTLTLGHSTADSMVTLTSAMDLNGQAAVIQTGDGSAAIDGRISGIISDTAGTPGSLTKTGDGTLSLTGANTYLGNTTVTAGTLILGASSETLFAIAATGVNNQLLGTGTLNLDGTLVFDLTNASTTISDSWNIVDVANLTETYGGTFAVSSTLGAFSDIDGDLWTLTENGALYQFSESTGVLSVVAIPEPKAALLGGIGVLLLFRRRRSA